METVTSSTQSPNRATEPVGVHGPAKHYGTATVILVTINVVGIVLGYATTILLARLRSEDGFEQYIGAVATITRLATLGEAGFGKYALRIVPVYVANQSKALLTGYLRFMMSGHCC